MACLSCEERRAKIAQLFRSMLHLPPSHRAAAREQAKKDKKLYQALAAAYMAEHPGWDDLPKID